jgi:membrane protein implicated in regulation of membrane protease activity
VILILLAKAAQLFLGLFAISLIYFAITPGQGLLELVKFMALSLGLSIAFLFLYPRLRQVRKGDQVTITGSMSMPFASLLGFTATALSDAQLGGELRVRINGREALGIVESYEGLLSPPKIQLVPEDVVR